MQNTSETILIWNLEKVVNIIEGRCSCVCPVSRMSVVFIGGESYIRSIETSGSVIWGTAVNDCNHEPGCNVYIPTRTVPILHHTWSHRTLCRTHTSIYILHISIYYKANWTKRCCLCLVIWRFQVRISVGPPMISPKCFADFYSPFRKIANIYLISCHKSFLAH
jgi:hypothetical protein